MELISIMEELSDAVDALRFSSPVSHVYNPLTYAREPFVRYLEKYGHGPKDTVFVGLNPGPYGMCQTGVPFGEIVMVRDWLGIEGKVEKPVLEHPKKPIHGFDCPRSEVSGRRLWGLIKSRFGTADNFFRRFFVINWCPLIFMGESGANITPDKLKPEERRALYGVCDRAIRAIIEELQPKHVIGVGKVMEKQMEIALAGLDVQLGAILHPSPASPAANRGWEEVVMRQLKEQGIEF